MKSQNQSLIFSNCGRETHGAHITYRAGEAIGRYRLVKLATDGTTVSIATASDRPFGLSTDEAAPGEELDIALLCSSDTLTARASGNLQAGDLLIPADGGGVQILPTAAGTYTQIGLALQPASNDAPVEIMPCVPGQRTVTAG